MVYDEPRTYAEEYEIVLQVLRTYESRLEIEIQHTDHAEFKQMLKHRREVVTKLLQRIAPA